MIKEATLDKTPGRTVRAWLETLPEPYRTQSLMNVPYSRWYKEVRSLAGAVNFFFTWSESPEGYAYWHDVLVRVTSGEFDVPEVEPVCDATLPEGFNRWEYRGRGWSPGKRLWYARALGFDHAYTYDGVPGGQGDSHFWEAVKDPTHADLKPTTPIPEGFDRWEYRGPGWEGRGVVYTTYAGGAGGDGYWDKNRTIGDPGGYSRLHYWEAVKDADPVCPLPVPEGFDRWEYRGWGWKTDKYLDVIVTRKRGHSHVQTYGRPYGDEEYEYWEAVKDPAPPKKPVGYRLLGPDDEIREGDETWDMEERPDVWSPMGAGFGKTYADHLPHFIGKAVWRRQIVSYEDALPSA